MRAFILKTPIWAGAAAIALGLTGVGAQERGLDEAEAQAAGAPAAADAAAVSSPLSLALQQALARAGGGKGKAEVAAFYAAHGYAPLWLARDGAPADRLAALMAALDQVEAHALPAARYDRAGLAAALRGEGTADLAARAALELALTDTYLRYARDISSGLLVPNKVDRELHHKPARPEPTALLEGLRAASDPAAMLAALAPVDREYAGLVERLTEYRRLARTGAWADPIPAGRTLRPGARSSRVEALRARLIAMGDLAPGYGAPKAGADNEQVAANDIVTDAPLAPVSQGTDPRVFDDVVVVAVKRFQARHGLNEDGVVGPATLAALNASPGDRARQIAVNLERLRWFNKELGRRHVMVNLAGFEMALVEDGEAIFTSRVVVGKSRKHRTPEFSDEIEHMVVNPTWHVPRSIAREEILPKLQADPTYLQRKNMRLVGADLPADQIDWSLVTPATFPGRVKQRPGGGNALGRVKFMFPNKWSIYLHDTPSKSLFNRDRRAYSHGCVRVQKPFEFAHELLKVQRADYEEYFSKVLRRGREATLKLDDHLPVHLTYRTAWVDEAGTDQFRTDVYGRDKKIYAALEKTGVDLLGD